MKQIAAVLVFVVMTPGICLAQAETNKSPEQKFYRLDFVVKEVDEGKIINSRSYSMMIAAGLQPGFNSIRTGNKVPFSHGNSPDYIDVGVNIDCRGARELQDQLSLTVSAEVSNLAPGQTPGSGPLPLLRQNKWNSEVIVALRKPTTIFSSDDPSSKHKMQLELTATPIR